MSRQLQKKNYSGETKGDSAIFRVEGKSERFSSLSLHLELMHVDFINFYGSIVGFYLNEGFKSN